MIYKLYKKSFFVRLHMDCNYFSLPCIRSLLVENTHSSSYKKSSFLIGKVKDQNHKPIYLIFISITELHFFL